MIGQNGREKISPGQRLQRLESPPAWPTITAFFFTLAYTVLFIAGQIIAATVGGGSYAAPTPGILVAGALLGCLAATGGIFVWARRLQPTTWIAGLRLRAGLHPPVFAVVLIGLGAAWGIDLIGVLLQLKGDQVIPALYDALRSPIGATWIATALLAVVVQPIAEGLVFAGLLYPALARDFRNNLLGVLAAVVIYTALSVAVFWTGTGIWFPLIQPFLMVLTMLLVRVYSQSTQSAMVARALFGLFFVLAGLINMRLP